MQGVFKKPFLSGSGMPANDERVGEIIRDRPQHVCRPLGQVMSQVAECRICWHTCTLCEIGSQMDVGTGLRPAQVERSSTMSGAEHTGDGRDARPPFPEFDFTALSE